jgi:hypothetical protein
MTPRTFQVGDFAMAALLLDREQGRIDFSTTRF